ncbi:hypothetical protein [Novosphingopyxis sp.]|uniref:hypothetical protein n=1 Tax=Novosphingopyxis sp. TaxID=2709690 RepID=UPI003B5C7134
MKTIALLITGLTLLSGCDRGETPAPAPTGAPETSMAAPPAPAPSATPEPATRDWRSEDGTIALTYPSALAPSASTSTSGPFPATYFTPEGWRAMSDAAPVGPGEGLVRFSEDTRIAGSVPRVATEILQIGRSDDADVIADCLTRGLEGGNGSKQPDRTIGGVRFTVYRNGDAGMSHQLSSTDLRAVHKGRCIAIDRLSSSVPAVADGDARPDRTSAEVEKDFDAVLASLTFE